MVNHYVFLFFIEKKKKALDVLLGIWEFIRSHAQFAPPEPAWNAFFFQGKIFKG